MKITKEEGRIVLELSPEEEAIVKYYVESRGSQVLYEYFDSWMDSRRRTKLMEEAVKFRQMFEQMSQEEKTKLLSGNWRSNG